MTDSVGQGNWPEVCLCGGGGPSLCSGGHSCGIRRQLQRLVQQQGQHYRPCSILHQHTNHQQLKNLATAAGCAVDTASFLSPDQLQRHVLWTQIEKDVCNKCNTALICA